jgi:taurine dioxygenase
MMDRQNVSTDYRSITVAPYNPTIGAVIGNVDLTCPLMEIEVVELQRALTEHLVLFFRDQRLSLGDQLRFAEYFGKIGRHVGRKTNSEPTDDPRIRRFHSGGNKLDVSGNVWHSDQSCAPVPPLASVLYLHTVPANGGGDTAFANMYEAYEALSGRMKSYLDGLTATHEGARVFGEGTPSAVHPVVVRHPESGRKLLYVNNCFTTRINEIAREESDAILHFLFEHCVRPEWSTRFRWKPHSLAIWDNRCTQHRAIADYLPNVRSGYRVQIEGELAPTR